MENKQINQFIISKRLIKINSFLVAVIISANILAIAINMITGLNNTVIFPFIICSLISFVVNRKTNLVVVIPLSLFFLSLFLLSFLQIGASLHLKDYLMSFCVFGITSFIIASQPFEVKKVMKYITLIYVSTSWIFLVLDIENMLPGNKMGLGYLILPVILVCIYHLSYLKVNLPKKLYYLIIIGWYGYFMIKVGTRGAILSIGLYIFLLFVLSKKITINRIIIYLMGFVIFIVVYSNILSILLIVKNILGNLGIKSYFIEKSVLLIEENNIFNGRDILYESAFNGFKESWFYGNGIGSFHDHYGTYIHNIFLQMLNESGVLLVIPLLLIICYGLFLLFFSRKIDHSFKLFICLIFTLAFPKLIVSSIFWKEQGFWILIIMIISFKFFKNYRFSKV
ncbi:O-antigen ligase family protein [Peribacillus butanolivorans]|uniref:O-antigen ligase family protein n=1 Tax=Peribacillus butanolivorans TaxID=421767 RepID=UPI0037C59082